MSSSALIMMIVVQVSVTIITGYFFYKVLVTPPKSEPDSYSENEEEQRQSMLIFQAIDSVQRAPDATGLFWGISEVVVTLIVFVGVYFIFKPVFGEEKNKKSK